MKILVIKRDKLGDLLLATPMLAHLKAQLPRAEVHLLANDYNAWVVDGNTDIDRRWIYRRVRNGRNVSFAAAFGLIAQNIALRREHFDWVVVANGEDSPRAIERGLSIRGSRCVAYCKDSARYARLSDPLTVQPGMHEMDRMMAMLLPLGISSPEVPILPRYILPGAGKKFSRDWLATKGIRAGHYVVLGLGARRPKKQPSTAQILRWSAHFKEAWDLDTVFMWTPGTTDNSLYPGDDEVAQPVLDANVPHLHPFRGPITEAISLIWSARTSLFPDSGLMHFAAASPGGVLGFFAEAAVSPSPLVWAPRGLNVDYLEAISSVSELEDAHVFRRVENLLAQDFSP
jgi:ADP-heptose:LPS heptosyltransferase